MSQDHDGPEEPIGSLGEEAAKLFGALADWAQVRPEEPVPPAAPPDRPDHPDAPDHPDLDGGATAHALRGLAEALRRVDEHVATGGSECRYCPVCQAIHAVRGTSPEVRAHLSDAAGSLLEAVTGLLADRRPGGPGSHRADRADPSSAAGPSSTGGVQRIDLTDSWDEPDRPERPD